ncbi:lytic transglycosylase domain-containing protein [Leifsonia sp. F6_8S_P_1B]|uniref:Lytic transglycosylase domain-containing protein n=1 Tax=Leifsonia williamsii TaxID=3035919 RepID=A0ABT8KDK1_9MICO|nr:lytic transglycosylase domain-containing protein [Leifsonia williamsii]MDN4615043.1 lytic transglycosylase domain-containing protein [Leifsonia williamsii]
MGRPAAAEIVPLTPANPVGVAFKRPRRPHIRSRAAIYGFAFTAAVGFALVNVVDPYSGSAATPAYAEALPQLPTTSRFGDAPVQSLTAPGSYTSTVTREELTVKPKPTPTPTPTPTKAPVAEESSDDSSGDSGGSVAAAPPAGTPDPGSAKAIAYEMLQARGMGDDEYSCLVSLWNRESGWNVYASNSSSGAYGIPQALPGSKMASAGPDWQSNAATQITWGLGYITGRYGTPCGAWSHSESSGWY